MGLLSGTGCLAGWDQNKKTGALPRGTTFSNQSVRTGKVGKMLNLVRLTLAAHSRSSVRTQKLAFIDEGKW